MAKKGNSPHLKRIAASRYVPISRKSFVWLAKPMPGTHSARESVALITLIKDVLKIADNSREAKRIIRSGDVLVDGRSVKRERFPIGLMDVVSIPKMKRYCRVIVDSHGRMKLSDIAEPAAAFKLCKVQRKGNVKGKKIQIGLHDGRNLVYGNEVHVGDTVKLALPEQKVLEVLRLADNANCLITKGKHAGKLGVIAKLHPRTSRREAEATLKTDGTEFTTVKKYLFVVGAEMAGA